jgi:GTPase
MRSAMVFGHVNVGKSTLLGHLLLKMGKISTHDFQILQAAAKENRRERSAFAYIMDNCKEEQESGNTHEYNTSEIEYMGHHYRFHDTPGHRVYITQFIEAVNQGPGTAILIVSADMSELESSISSGVLEEYTIMCRCLGIKNLVVAINKLDKIKWGDYEPVCQKVREIIGDLGYNLTFVPCTAYTGEGLTERTLYYPEAPCLLECISDDPPPKTLSDPCEANQCTAHIKIFRKTLITKGWSATCHIGASIVECEVLQVFDKKKKPCLTACTGEVILVLKIKPQCLVFTGQRILLRNPANNTTVAGGLILKTHLIPAGGI